MRSDLEAQGRTSISVACVRFAEGDWRYDHNIEWHVEVLLDGFGGWLPVGSQGWSWPAFLEDVADRMSEEYIDLLWEARPKCPLHEHPLDAHSDEQSAWWSCPAAGTSWMRPIGTLASDPEYLAALR